MDTFPSVDAAAAVAAAAAAAAGPSPLHVVQSVSRVALEVQGFLMDLYM